MADENRTPFTWKKHASNDDGMYHLLAKE